MQIQYLEKNIYSEVCGGSKTIVNLLEFVSLRDT
jgi:hypothetical protein